jgi:hypothetical protein
VPSEEWPSYWKGSKTGSCTVSFPHSKSLFPSLECVTLSCWGNPTSASSHPPCCGEVGSSAWKPPLRSSSSFQFGFELPLVWQGPGGRGEWGVGRLDRKALVLSAPCLHCPPRQAFLRARDENLELPPSES